MNKKCMFSSYMCLLWFNFILGLNFLAFVFRYGNVWQCLRKFKPRIKYNIEQQHVQITDVDLSSIVTRLFFEDRCVRQISWIFFISNQVKVETKRFTIFLNFPFLGFLSKCECSHQSVSWHCALFWQLLLLWLTHQIVSWQNKNIYLVWFPKHCRSYWENILETGLFFFSIPLLIFYVFLCGVWRSLP